MSRRAAAVGIAWVGLMFGIVALTPAIARAAAINYFADYRYIAVQYIGSLTSAPFAPFHESISNPSDGSAAQDSVLGPQVFTVSASASSNPQGSASSVIAVNFMVNELTYYSLTGELTSSGSGSNHGEGLAGAAFGMCSGSCDYSSYFIV